MRILATLALILAASQAIAANTFYASSIVDKDLGVSTVVVVTAGNRLQSSTVTPEQLKTLVAGGITSLTNDVTGTGPGATVTTLAAVQGQTVSGSTGTSGVVFNVSPVLTTPNLGTPSTLVCTNCSGTAASLTAGTATNATNASTVSVSNSASYFPMFAASSANSNQPFNLGTGLTFNPSTNNLATTTFTGALSGTATNATNGATVSTSSNASFFPLFAASSSNGNQPFNLGTGLTFNPSTNNLSTTTFTGALTGTASGNTTYTANNHGVVVSGSGNAMTVIAPDASTSKVLTSGGASADPTWQAVASAPTMLNEAYNVGLSASITSSILSIALVQSDGATNCAAGSAACKIGMRQDTVAGASGMYQEVSITAAQSISVGTTAGLGHTSLATANVYVYEIQDSTNELCVSNSPFLTDDNLHSATATPATTGGVLYCNSTHTSRPTKLLGIVQANWANPNWSAITKVTPVPWPRRFDESIMRFGGSQQGAHTYAANETVRIDTIDSGGDTFNAFNTSTWTYTVQIPAICQATSNTSFGSLDGVTDAYLSLNTCGVSRQCYGSRLASNGAASAEVADCSNSRNCSAGDTIVLTVGGDASYVLDTNGTRTRLNIECFPTAQ